MRVLQVVPAVHTGSGVEAVAYHLEREWRALGVPTAQFTLAEAHGDWIGQRGPLPIRKLGLLGRVVWFTTVGTALARRVIARQPRDTVVICHNDALVGDVYVNHGNLVEAMRRRGGFAWRMARNPLHLFTWARDGVRYRSHLHRVVVNLTAQEDADLRRTYPGFAPRTVVIGNGVDTERYRPDPDSRAAARAELGLTDEPVVLFVGHEFERKGLPLVLDAVARLDRAHLVVVGGTPDLVAAGRRDAAARGLDGRVHYVGQQADPRRFFHAADVFAFPSAYESYGLVILEALASGVPVVASPVGCVPEVVVDGVNGYAVGFDADAIAAALGRVLDRGPGAWTAAARASAEDRSWARVAQEYLALFEDVLRARG
nr:glycosyltransferase family 4 protein [Propionibacterium sp.]